MARAVCEYPECGRVAHSRGHCTYHYKVRRKQGMLPSKPYWIVDEATGCWLWNRKRWVTGYGMKSVNHSGSVAAHRWLYEREVGPIPEGLELDHLCFNPPCVNPDHMEPVTHTENMRRQWVRRRA